MKLKPFVAVAVILFTTLTAVAQGTLSYGVAADSTHALPPNSSTRTASGTFTLEPSLLFKGGVFMEQWLDVDSVSLFRSTSSSQVGTKLYDFTPGGIVNPDTEGNPGGRLFTFERTLSSTEVADLDAGLWWVSVITPGFPNGEIRGQITAVPEPSTYALIIAGVAFLGIRRARR